MKKCKHANYSLTEQVHGYNSYTFKDGQWQNDCNAYAFDLAPSGLLIFECNDCGFKREYRNSLPTHMKARLRELQAFQQEEN